MTLNQRGGLFRPELIKRLIIYSLLLLLLASLQCSFFAGLHILPATPDLLLGAILAIILLDSKRSAAIVAICGGVLADALGGSGYSLSPLFFLIFAVIMGAISEKILPSFFSYMILLLPAILMREAYTCLCILAVYGSLPIVYTAKNILLPEAVCTFVVCLAVYPLVRLCTRPFGTRNKFSF